MRHFIYFSKSARTSGNFNVNELMKAGRMDIVCQVIMMAFFVSHHIRENVKLHLIFAGGPDPVKHLEMCPGKNFMADNEQRRDISQKDIAGLIKKILCKYKKGEKREVSPGYFIEKKNFIDVIEELIEQGKTIYLLDKKGEDIRDVKKLDDATFIIGDQDGIPKRELKKLKKLRIKKISVGNQIYFASQTVTIINNELDRRNI
ncbi:MAG TPA: tRNA (pseudouridine(54)-N(1))-methyltransferase TrmY [Candidatus Paceibacterota bacterium]|nr:tRNA (pseudouridine(54)-N(1))-methyltransferase TrmY [Candidatus Paceibacterota bacterium]